MEQFESQETFVASYDIMGFRDHYGKNPKNTTLEVLTSTFNKIPDYLNILRSKFSPTLQDIIVSLKNDENNLDFNKPIIEVFETLIVCMEDIVEYELQADNVIVWMNYKNDSIKTFRKEFVEPNIDTNARDLTLYIIEFYYSILFVNFLQWNIAINAAFMIESNWLMRGAISHGEFERISNPNLIAGKAVLDAHSTAELQNSFTTIICRAAEKQISQSVSFLINVFFPRFNVNLKNSEFPIIYPIFNPFFSIIYYMDLIKEKYGSETELVLRLFDSLNLDNGNELSKYIKMFSIGNRDDVYINKVLEGNSKKDVNLFKKWVNTENCFVQQISSHHYFESMIKNKLLDLNIDKFRGG